MALILFGFRANAAVALLLLPFVGRLLALARYAAPRPPDPGDDAARLRGRMIGLFAALYWGFLPSAA